MDHLPYPLMPVQQRLEIPYICADILANKELSKLSRVSVEDEARWEHWSECDPDEAAQELQAFVYFALLADVLGESFHIATFVRFSNLSQGRVVTLVGLLGRLEKLYPDSDFRIDQELMRNARKKARSIAWRSALVDKIYLSIQVLTWSLECVARSKDNSLPSTDDMHAQANSIIVERMLATGWCPYWTKILQRRLIIPILHYLSGLPRRMRLGHDACSTSRCCAHNVTEPKMYVSRHTEAKCPCRFRGPDPKKIASIIAKGGIPLVSLVVNPEGKLDIDVAEVGLERPYIAISHVWSGGLGNPRENKLATCQLKAIYAALQPIDDDFLSSLPGSQKKLFKRIRGILGVPPLSSLPVYIWFDTLCIPVGKDSVAERLRRDAINKMAYTYARAEEVLVIDPVIRRVIDDRPDSVELTALMLISPWMSRCWTYQEARLATRLSFLLKDTTIDLSSWQRVGVGNQKLEHVFRKSFKYQFLRFTDEIPSVTSTPSVIGREEQEIPIVPVWNALSERSTTKPDDLHGILAVVLKLSVSEVLDLDVRHRMFAILRSQQKLPLSMLLLRYSTKVSLAEGCGWVPSYPSRGLGNSSGGTMSWRANSSTLEFLPSATGSVVLTARISNEVGTCLTVVGDLPTCTLETRVHQSIDIWLYPPNEEALSRCKNSKICLLLHKFTSLGIGQPLNGACFQVVECGDSPELNLSFVCPALYARTRPETSTTTENTDAPSDEMESITPLTLTVETISSETRCIIHCDPATWPMLKYRRPAVQTLQKSLSPLVCILICSVWLVLSSVTFVDPASQAMAFSFTSYFEYLYDFMPWWIKWIGFMNDVVLWMLSRYPRATAIGLINCLRLIILWVEYGELDSKAERIGFAKFAGSFDYIPVSQTLSQDAHFEKEPLYQYQPLWRLSIPVLLGASNLIAATWPHARPYVFHWPFGPEVSPKLIGFVGQGVLLETIIRVVGETVWRYFRMDVGRTEQRV